MKPCAFCGASATGEFREIVAWTRRRGGMFGRRETGRVACADCAYDLRNGQTPGTPKLPIP